MIIQAIVVAVSFGRRDLGGHSLKRGALTTGMERGVVSPSLKRLGRHKSFRVWLLWPVSRNHPPPRGEAGWQHGKVTARSGRSGKRGSDVRLRCVRHHEAGKPAPKVGICVGSGGKGDACLCLT